MTELEGESPDLPFGMGTGAAMIFGTTGGVAEAVARRVAGGQVQERPPGHPVLRTCGAARPSVTVNAARGGPGAAGSPWSTAWCNAQKLLQEIEEGQGAIYDLVEVMTCQGGCVGGAGQPYGLTAAKKRRGAGLYAGGLPPPCSSGRRKTPSSPACWRSTAMNAVMSCCTSTTENKKAAPRLTPGAAGKERAWPRRGHALSLPFYPEYTR